MKPWSETWTPFGRGVLRDDDGLQIHVLTAVSGNAETVRAVANLAAAAPELYRALEAIVRAAERPPEEGASVDLDVCRAALRKARGEP